MTVLMSRSGALRCHVLGWAAVGGFATAVAGVSPVSAAAVVYPSGVGPIRVAFAKVVSGPDPQVFAATLPGDPIPVGRQDLYAGALGSKSFERLSGDGTRPGPFSREFYEVAFSDDATKMAVIAITNYDSDLRDTGSDKAGDIQSVKGSGRSVVAEQAIWVTDLSRKRTRRVSPPWRSPTTGEVLEDVREYSGVQWTADSRTIITSKHFVDEGREVPAAFDAFTGKSTPVTAPMRALWERVQAHSAISPDGKSVAKAEGIPPLNVHAIVRIRQGQTTVVSQRFLADYGHKGVYWTPDSRYVVAATLVENMFHSNCVLHLIDATDGRSVRSLPLRDGLGHIGFSHNGRWLIALDGKDIALWNWRTGEKRILPGPKCQVAAMDWMEWPAKTTGCK